MAVEGFFSALLLPNVLPRYLHFLLACLALTGLFLVWLFRRAGADSVAAIGIERGELIRLGYRWALIPTLAQFLVGPPKVIVLKRELMYIPFFGWGLWQLRSIAVDRGAGASAVNQVVAQGTARLREGLSTLIFPEGTRVAAGETRRYGVSGALLASRAGCNVVPVAHDAGYYWPRRGLLKNPGTIRVVVGPPIAAGGRDPREVNDEAQVWIETTIARLRAEEATRLRTEAGARLRAEATR